jgi:hypothetical protein
LNYEQKLIGITAQQKEINEIFQILHSYDLTQAFLCGGSLRNLIWDHLSNRQPNFIRNNIDVIYADHEQSSEAFLTIQEMIKVQHSKFLWNIQNICLNNSTNHEPYGQTIMEALKTIPETCSAFGLTITLEGEYQVLAPFGLKDLFNFEIHPTQMYSHDQKKLALYQKRLEWKEWPATWPQIKVFTK